MGKRTREGDNSGGQPTVKAMTGGKKTYLDAFGEKK